jgi:N-formylglutamate deformylase
VAVVASPGYAALMIDEVVAVTDRGGPVIATAIHDGHTVRPEIAGLLALDDATRLREEDPYTNRLAQVAPTHLVALRSRFEVDLNRPRDAAVYRVAADSWGLEVWRDACSDELVAGSLAVYDAFYALLEKMLQKRRQGRFVVLDIHSYNHRREGSDARPADPAENPEINIGTGTLDETKWGGLVDRFCADLAAQEVCGHRLDVRKNLRFEGGEMSAWVNSTFSNGCAIAVEYKKTFMDEWTGRLDADHMNQLCSALAATLPGLRESLAA